MGLDISAYEHASLIPGHPVVRGHCKEHEDYRPEVIRACVVHHSMLPSTDGLEMDADHPEPSGFVWGPCLRTGGQDLHFRAGSYSGYNRWREALAESVGELVGEGEPDRPFGRLIWFADNEGTIGPKAAATLLTDFHTYRDRFVAHVRGSDEYVYLYDEWTKAFNLAADTGCVDFG